MSLVKSKAIQLGFDATPTNNFLIYQPLTPDGTFRIANGNQGATTDIMTVTSGGSVTFAGTTNFSSLNFGAGSASAPSLFPTGDSNTGIWFPAADTFAVSTGGSERLRISAAGKTTLSGALATTGFDLTASTNPYFTKPTAYSLSFDNAGGLNSANPYWLGYQFASPLVTQSGTNMFPRASHFYSYTTTADPTDLTYNIWLGNAGTLNQNMYLSAGNAGGYMAFGTSSVERLRIDSTGNTFMYGQGAASKGTLTLQSADSFLRLKTTGGTADKQQWDLRAISATGSEAFEIRTINDANTVFSTKLWISNSGDIGVGNTSPYVKLSVSGAILSEASGANIPNILLGSPGLNYGQIQNDGTGIWSLGYGATNAAKGTAVLTWNASGNVGINNASPSEKLDVSGTIKAKSFKGTYAKTYHYSTLFNTPGNGSRRFHIGRLFENNYANWGHYGTVKIRVYDSYYSSGGFREYTLAAYGNNLNAGTVTILQTGGTLTGSSANYKISLGPQTATGLTYGSQPINYYNIYLDTQQYVQCSVEIEMHGAYTSSFDITTPTTTGYGSGNYWMTEFYTDTYVSTNYTDDTVTGSFKWSDTRSTILAQTAWASYSDQFQIDLRYFYNQWKTVEVYVNYYTSSPTRCDHFLQLKDANNNAMSVEWNCWSMKRNASGSGGFVWVDNSSTANVWGRYTTTTDSGNHCFFKFTVDLSDPTGDTSVTVPRPGVMWDGNYTWGDIGASRATGSCHPVGGRIAYLILNQDASSGYSGIPAGYYKYTIVGIN